MFNELVEQGPRFAEFLTTLEKEGNNPDSIVKALYNANEITENFNRSGTLGKWLNANGATFLNAGIQDVARTAKLLKQGKVGKLLYNAALFGIAPSLINEALCGDDPNYQRIRTQDKDVNFYIPTGDGKFLKIPKGRVTGTIATVPQRVMRELMGNTDKSETMLQGVLAAQGVLIGDLAGGLRAEFIGEKYAGGIEHGVLVVAAFLHQANQQGAGAVMQGGEIHVDHNGLAGLHRVAHILADDLFNECLSHD